ncbi:MAG TPA: PDZ domain-containing protein, partial [Terriglobales bacterium]|nr:PDZ domain-containing protein [Terriglobales bacterium]
MFQVTYAMKAFIVAFLMCAFCPAPNAQETERRYTIGIDITGSKPPCPVFVNSVRKNSPAAQAGIKPGDRLIAVDGNIVKTVQDAAQRIRSTSTNPVALQFAREDKLYTVTVPSVDFASLLRQNGWKMLKDGAMVNSDATDAEVKYFVAIRQALENTKDLS